MQENFDERLKTTDQWFYGNELVGKVISAIEQDSHEMSANVWFAQKDTREQAPGYLKLRAKKTDVERVISALAENSHISQLGFSGYFLDDNAMLRLKEVLAKNKSVTSITFYYCDFPEGIVHLAEALENSPHLTEIRFEQVPLGDKSAQKIANALKKNRSLKTISFIQTADVSIEERGALALLEGLKENYHIVNFNFKHSNFSLEETVNEKGKEFLKRNQRYAQLCSVLDESFVSLDQYLHTLEYYRNKQNKGGFNLMKGAADQLLNKTSDMIKALEVNSPVAEWQRKLDRAKLKFTILSSDNEVGFPQLLDAYIQHFSDGTDEIMNSRLALALFSFINEAGDFESLGFEGFDKQLGCRWLLRLLKGNDSEEAKNIRNYAYEQIHSVLPDSDRMMLTIAELEILKKVLIDSKHEVFETFKSGGRIEQSKINELNSEEEKFAARVLHAVSYEKEIAIYEKWMLMKKDGDNRFLPSRTGYTYDGWFKALKLEIEEAKQQEKEWETQFFAKLRKSKISHDIAITGWNSAYANVLEPTFNALAFSPANINTDHSRSLSAYRLAKASNSQDYTYEQTLKILQIEYHALPNQDKKGASHYTFWRHRTLENWLENVFEKNNITPLRSEELSEPEKLASFLLSWIGDQERSFAYKVSKDQKLINMIVRVGEVAHRTILSPENDFEALKNSVNQEILDYFYSLHSPDEARILSLVSEINQKFPAAPQHNF